MREWIPILVGCAMGGWAFLLLTPKGARLQRARIAFLRKPLLNIGLVLFAAAFLLAWTAGAAALAGWLHDTAAPGRAELREARAILAAPFAIPFVVLALWLRWHEGRAIGEGVRRARSAPGFVDAGREHRLPAARNVPEDAHEAGPPEPCRGRHPVD